MTEEIKEPDITTILNTLKRMSSDQANILAEAIKAKQEQEMSDNAVLLYNNIWKVRVVDGIISTDVAYWDIYIGDKVIRVPTDKLEKMKTFREQYIKVFKVPAPLIDGYSWIKLLNALTENKLEKVIINPEESENVRIARELFEKIRRLEIDDSEEGFDSGMVMYSYRGGYYLKSSAIERMISEAFYKIAISKLSETMTELGMKKLGAKKVRQQRCWEFIASELEIKEEDVEE
jgi:hypothetical protein